MFKTISDKLKRIQRADEKIKKRWLIGLTSGAMIIIIGLWLIFINVSDIPVRSVANPKTAPSVNQKQNSVWQTFKLGFNKIVQDTKEKLNFAKQELKEQIQKNNEIVIENQNLSLTPPALTTSTVTSTNQTSTSTNN